MVSVGTHVKSLAGGYVPTYVSGAKLVKFGLFDLGGPYLYSWTGEAWTNLGDIVTYLFSLLLNYEHTDNRDFISRAPRRVKGAYSA